VCVAQNEQLPWTENEIGYPTRPMFLISESGAQQVGDYQFYVNGQIGGILVERKTCQDFYGTMFGNRDRFYREIERFKSDNRFDKMIIFVEGNMLDFLNYTYNNNSFMLPQKFGVLGSLDARGVEVMWCTNRKIAARLYGVVVKQWCLKNYERII